MRATKENQEFWWNHVAAVQKSGLSRRKYCEQNNLKISSLDYWRNKIKSSSTPVVRPDSENRWLTLQVADQPIAGTGIGIRLRIGRLAIDVEPGFDHKLLADVLRVAGSAC
jgi:hypothetical protein